MAVLNLFDDQGVEESRGIVRVIETHLGKAVVAERSFPAGAIIGEITGRVFDDDSASDDYTFEYENQLLDPVAPFRFLNHGCEPNCEFDIVEIPESDDGPAMQGLFLMAVVDIRSGEELTIDYNWPATSAITCLCRSEKCRGWVVAEEELSLLN